MDFNKVIESVHHQVKVIILFRLIIKLLFPYSEAVSWICSYEVLFCKYQVNLPQNTQPLHNFIEITFRHGYCSVNLPHILQRLNVRIFLFYPPPPSLPLYFTNPSLFFRRYRNRGDLRRLNSLTITTKCSILDVAPAHDPRLRK